MGWVVTHYHLFRIIEKLKNIKFICLPAPQMRICKDSTKQIKEQKVFFYFSIVINFQNLIYTFAISKSVEFQMN
jgi:hypothetical protein